MRLPLVRQCEAHGPPIGVGREKNQPYMLIWIHFTPLLCSALLTEHSNNNLKVLPCQKLSVRKSIFLERIIPLTFTKYNSNTFNNSHIANILKILWFNSFLPEWEAPLQHLAVKDTFLVVGLVCQLWHQCPLCTICRRAVQTCSVASEGYQHRRDIRIGGISASEGYPHRRDIRIGGNSASEGFFL